MDNTIEFGTLTAEGKLTNVRHIHQASITACPFYIMVSEHYRDDGTCKCDDPEHRKMMKKNWGYKDKDFKEAGLT